MRGGGLRFNLWVVFRKIVIEKIKMRVEEVIKKYYVKWKEKRVKIEGWGMVIV